MQKLSIIIPIYNEDESLSKILKKVQEQPVPLEKEIILVDDCSTDTCRDILTGFKDQAGFKVIYHKHNQGKGAALRTGFKHATGDIILIQDADMEYDPADYPKLLRPILEGKTDVVYGNRFWRKKKALHFTERLHTFGNNGLTLLTNMLYSCKIHDMETCYKVFTRKVLKGIPRLRARRFDFEPEFTAKMLKRGFKIVEVPISYRSRDFDDGKKITWKDGMIAAYSLIKYRLMD
jgi:glycosyltransferase involved in cell wall biosynthesis